MYRYSESSRRRLSPELILRDAKEKDRGASFIAVFLLILAPAGALLVTAIMSFVGVFAGAGAKILCGVFWLCAAVIVFFAASLLRRVRKPLRPSDMRVVKCRLEAIEQDKYPYARHHVRGQLRTVPRELFRFDEGLDPYLPGQTQLALADVGDEYYVVTHKDKPSTPILVYRADAYIWDEPQESR